MVYESRAENLPSILVLWMEGVIHAHLFTKERYQCEGESIVRDAYLPAAQTWVWEEGDELKGFADVIDDHFLDALFVVPAAIKNGIGKALVQHAQQRFSILSPEVYQKNQPVMNSYHALGFRIEDDVWQGEIHHPTWIMGWQVD